MQETRSRFVGWYYEGKFPQTQFRMDDIPKTSFEKAIDAWEQAKEDLNRAKDHEMIARLAVIKAFQMQNKQ